MPDKSGEVFSSDAPNGDTTTGGGVDIETGHQTQYDSNSNTRESRDGKGDWHHTNQNLPKGHPDRHKR